MRKVLVQELVSVDGLVAGPDGELDFFEAVADYSEVDRDNLVLLEDVERILLGRTTYELFVGYWPTADETMAESVNTIPKTVFSSTLEVAPWGDHAPAEVVGGDAVAHVRGLREGDGGTLLVWGSIALTRSLLHAGLVDELQLRVVPTLVGDGRRLVEGSVEAAGLRLLEAKPYPSGIVGLHYALGR